MKEQKDVEKYIVYLDVPQNNSQVSSKKIGYKAYRLAQMGGGEYRTPGGFTISNDAFKDFCAYNNIILSNTISSHQELVKEILDGEFSPEMSLIIEESINKYPYKQYAVRSSSASEDSLDFSMAGQFDTFLNTPRTSIFDMIKKCWASMFNNEVIAYAQKNNLPLAFDMGVIVQEQIDPLFSGVIFTMNPITKSTDHIVVEWIEGMGDKLVSGQVNPERMYINRISQVIPSIDTIPESLKINLNQLITYALKAEKQFNHPIDIEWCVDTSGPVIVQARPITGITGDDSILWTNVNMAENFPDVLTPFTWSIVDTFYKYLIRNMMKLFGWKDKQIYEARSIIDNIVGVQSGRAYYNLSNWYEGAHFLPISKWLTKMIDSFIGQNVPYNFKPKSVNKWVTKGWKRPLQMLSFWIHLLKYYVTADYHINKYEKMFYKERLKWREIPYSDLSLEDLIDVLEKILDSFVKKYYYNPGLVDILSAIFPGGCKLLTKKWLSNHVDDTELLSVQLMQGIKVRSTEPTRLISIMSQEIKKREDLQSLLVNKKYTELKNKLDTTIKILFDEFMDNYGGRCYKDCLITSPTFEERHDLYWELVLRYQDIKSPDLHDKEKENNENRIQLLKQTLKKLTFIRRIIFRKVLKNAHRAIRLRERSRLIRSLLHGEIRMITLVLGEQLTSKNHLSDTQDIFYLNVTEIKDLVRGKFQFPETIPDLIAMRKKAFVDNGKNTQPSFFIKERGSYFDPALKNEHPIAINGSILKGVAVSGGKIKARARVILDPVEDNRLEPGDILVTTTTDPGWTPLFRIAGGLIIEKGGMLSHGAIIAREFGIPAIAGIEDVTTIIKDGKMLAMNGDFGEIEILD